MKKDNTSAWDPLPELIPVRMLNAYTFCPRLAYLEWVQGEFAPSAFTLDGKYQHRNVDSPTKADVPDAIDEKREIRSVYMSANQAGLTGIMDLVEFKGKKAVPVDYKRGKRAPVKDGLYDPEKIQLCAHSIILQENGYEVDHGVAYFAGEKRRVTLKIDEKLKKKTLKLLDELRKTAASGIIPQPLDDDRRCPGCSLVGICLPDEVDFLHHDEGEAEETKPRMILPSADESLPVYVQDQGVYIGKSYGNLLIKQKRQCLKRIPMHEISHLALFGNVQISTQAMQSLCYRNIPVCFFSMGGWFYGILKGLGHKNIELRNAQHRCAQDEKKVLDVSRRIVADKIKNCRTLLRRNSNKSSKIPLRSLSTLAEKAQKTESLSSLLGIEGSAASVYFQNFNDMLKIKEEEKKKFNMQSRNRRPPRDPINALLSFAYALLVKTWIVTVQTVGLDPYLGFYHQIKYGKPALALDMMEPFRPLIADSAVILALNNNVITSEDFTVRISAASMKPNARKKFITVFEKRLSQNITHPIFGYKISYRQVFEVQARLLGRYLTNEIDEPPAFTTH